MHAATADTFPESARLAAPFGEWRLKHPRKERIRRAAGQLMSLLAHLAILALLLIPTPAEQIEEGGGGTGWANEIEITASSQSSSGYQGDNATENQSASAPERGPASVKIQVEIVSEADLAPKPPAPPLTAAADELLSALEAPLTERESIVPIKEVGELTPEAAKPNAEVTAATAPTNSGTVSAGGSGMQDAPLGSVRGTGPYGYGSGISDRSGRGDHLSGEEIANAFAGFTIIGTEGYYDGSTWNNGETRTEFPWRVYYAPTGMAEARFSKPAAAVAHGPIEVRAFSESGTYRIEGDLLCQSIEKVGYGAPVCFEVHRKGNEVALYYASCGALSRCFPGRLGPTGILKPGRALD